MSCKHKNLKEGESEFLIDRPIVTLFCIDCEGILFYEDDLNLAESRLLKEESDEDQY